MLSKDLGKDNRGITVFRAVLTATLVYAVFLVVQATKGDQPVYTDNDSMMRLVMVRDWLAGQGWFDPMQYRMGVEGGFAMHWSRLVDAPIAAILIVTRFLGADGAVAAGWIWPILTFAAALYLLAECARLYSDDEAILPATVIGAIALVTTGVFNVGLLDHHNVQLVLALLIIRSFLVEAKPLQSGWIAGISAGLMLAVGVETLHLVAIAGLGAALFLIFNGEAGRRFAGGFGSGLALTSIATFFGTVSPARYADMACDANSATFLIASVVSGAGMAILAAWCSERSPIVRAAGCAALGMIVAATAVLFFPHCLADPYAQLDPAIRFFWLDHVAEAKPLTSLLPGKPGAFAIRAVTPLLAIGLVLWQTARSGPTVPRTVMLAILVFSYLVMFWQIRGGVFATTIAVVPLASAIGMLRKKSDAVPGSRITKFAMITAWVLSVNAAWGVSAQAFFAAPGKNGVAQEAASLPLPEWDRECTSPQFMDSLNQLPAQKLLALSNMGSSILMRTRHSVFSGPYHRNADGFLVMINAFRGEPDAARAVITKSNADLVVVCRTSDEAGFYVEAAPDGLLSLLVTGTVPTWLEPVPLDNAPDGLAVYRIRR